DLCVGLKLAERARDHLLASLVRVLRQPLVLAEQRLHFLVVPGQQTDGVHALPPQLRRLGARRSSGSAGSNATAVPAGLPRMTARTQQAQRAMVGPPGMRAQMISIASPKL